MDEFEQFLKQQPLRQVPSHWRREVLKAAEACEPAKTAGWWWRLALPSAITASVLVAIGLVLRVNPRQSQSAATSAAVTLASGWRMEPTGQAVYHVLKSDLIRLERGELYVESVPLADGGETRSELKIETPDGLATAKGTKFYIGAYAEEGKQPMKQLTRVLVLSGVVSLANAYGEATGTANNLLVAEAGKPPVNHAVTANSSFAVDLYGQLAKENPGQNLFFSPYSMSCALTMTAEGARGQTAEQMGRVLGFPAPAQRLGQDAQLLPWNTALIHTGMKELRERFNPKPASKELTDQIAALRKTFEESKVQEQELRSARKWEEYRAQTEKTKQAAAELNRHLAQVDQYELRVANALYGEQSYQFQQAYLDTINGFYGTGAVVPVDFKHNFEAARLQINEWVEDQTKNRIKDLLAAGSLDEYTRLVLCNAVYFKGDWSVPFEVQQTKEEDFQTGPDTKARVAMMRKDKLEGGRYGAFNADGSFFQTPRRVSSGSKLDPQTVYPGKEGFVVAELPYKGKELTMAVIVPRDAGELEALEQKLTSANLQAWFDKLESREMNVQMPKFKLETDYQQMENSLQAMGMVRAFNDPRDPVNGAQFDGISVTTDPNDKLYITKVCHKAFVEVNEYGTEAAAATAVVMMVPASAPATVPFVPTIRADKPFLFAIRDVKTGTILFMGRMMNPTK